jgi:hypothetical protein
MLSKETRNSAFITADNTKVVETVQVFRHFVAILKQQRNTYENVMSSRHNSRNVAAGLKLKNYATMAVLAVHSYISIVA